MENSNSSEHYEISDDDYLLRRALYPNPTYFKPDGTICSSVFMLNTNDYDGLSVNIKALTTYDATILDRKKYRLVEIEVGKVKEKGLEVEHEPLEGNPAHALIKGNLSKGVRRKLAKAASVLEE